MSEKFIIGKDELEQKARLRAFQQSINPKPSPEEIARLKKERIEARKVTSVNLESEK